MSKNLIEIKKLKKEFKNNNSVVKVLNNVNINIESGKLVALVGPSGSGKSTFLHLLALLDEPTQGKIFLFGNSTANISEDKKNKIIKDYISIIFQNNNLLSDFTALENVAIPLIILFFLSSEIFAVEFPNKKIFPLVGSSNKASKCKRVDFPEPEGPTSATNLPDSIFMFTLFNTFTTELLFLNSFFNFFISIKFLLIF